MSIKAFNAVEIHIDTVEYGGEPCITVWMKRPGSTQGSIRAFLDLDAAGVLAAMISNRVDIAKRLKP